MSVVKKKLTLYQPAIYQIKVSGKIDENWSDWAEEITVEIGSNDDGLTITSLTGNIDQAALLGLLRRLYSLGLPLISVQCLGIS